MTTLPIKTLVGNAAAVLCGVYGAVTGQARLQRCSRQTVYKHTQIVQNALQSPPPPTTLVAPPALNPPADPRTTWVARDDQRHFAIVACASGTSTRQVEHFLRVLIRDDAPDHTTITRWVADAAHKAHAVLEGVDRVTVPLVKTIAGDEIFLATDQPSWESSPTA